VFFSNDLEKRKNSTGDWKVVCGMEVRGRRGDIQMGRPEIGILTGGRDEDFQGLQM